jgi:hypothetical protein
MSDLGDSIRKVLAVAFGGAVVAAGIYMAYRYVKSQSPETDEEDLEIDSEEPDGDTASEYRLVVLGLDGAGKSSLMAALAGQKIPSSIPVTEGFNVINMNMEDTTWNLWEGDKQLTNTLTDEQTDYA